MSVTYVGFVDKAISLFAELEKRNWKMEAGPQLKKGKKKQQDAGTRELRRLQCSVNYDSNERNATKGTSVDPSTSK